MGSVNIWKETVTYDELTINECQKKDALYSKILNEVRSGCVSEDSLDCLCKQIITSTVDIATKYKELCESGLHPVCLFPTCKACQDHNAKMLCTSDAKMETFICVL